MNLDDCNNLFSLIESATDPQVIASGFHQLFDIYPLLNYEMGRGSIFWRGRKSSNEDGFFFSSANELHCPPPEKTYIQRLNDKGVPCLYAATRRTTVFRELEAQQGDYIHLVGLRMSHRKAVRIIAIGDLFHVHKTGYTRILGKDIGQALTRILNNMDRESATTILYIDAFLGELLADKEAKSKDYLATRVLTSVAYTKCGAKGMFYPSVKDHIGMNLSVLAEAYYSNMEIVCSQVIRIKQVHKYGFCEYEVVKQATGIDDKKSFVWIVGDSDRLIIFNLTGEEIQFVSSMDEEGKNNLLDLMSLHVNK